MADFNDILKAMTTGSVDSSAPIFSAPTDSTDVLGIEKSKNLQTVAAARTNAQVRQELVGLTKQQEVLQQQTAKDLDELSEAITQHLSIFVQEAEEEARALTQAIDTYDQAAMAAQVKLAGQMEEGVTSFWKNPIQNLRDKSQIRKTEKELVQLDEYRRNAQLQKNRIYQNKAKEIKQWREHKVALDYQAIKSEYNQNLTSLQAKEAAIEQVRLSNLEVQQLSQQLVTNMEAWRQGKDVEDNSSMAEFYYYLTNNGDVTGFVAERDVKPFAAMYNSLPQDQQLSFVNNFMQYQKAKLSGVPLSIGEFSLLAGRANGLEGLSNFALLVGDDSFRNTLTRGQNLLLDQEIGALMQEWEDNKATVDQKMTNEEYKNIVRSAHSKVSTMSEAAILGAAVQSTSQAFNAFATTVPSEVFYGDAALAAIESSSLPEDAKAFFRTEAPQRAQSKALEIVPTVGSEPVAYAVALIEEMDAAGLDEITVVDTLQTLFTEASVGAFFSTPEGDDAKNLQRLGLTFGHKTGFEEIDDLVIPIELKFKLYEDTPYATSKTRYQLPVLQGEEGILEGYLKSQGTGEIDLGNRADLTQLITRVGRRQRAYERGRRYTRGE